MNRNINKLRKIFSCCGKNCVKKTNGEALDDLVKLAESGELGSSGVEGGDKYYLYWFGYGAGYSDKGTTELYSANATINRFVYLKNIPNFSNVQPNQSFELYYYGQGDVVKQTVQMKEITSDLITYTAGTPPTYLVKVTDDSWSKLDCLDKIPLLQNIELTENKTWCAEKNYVGAGEIKINVLPEPMKNGRFSYPYTNATVGATCQTSKRHINDYTDCVVYLMLFTGDDGIVTKKMTIADLESGSQTISISYGADLNDSWRMKIKVSFENQTTNQGSVQYWLKAEVMEVGSNFYSDATFCIGCLK